MHECGSGVYARTCVRVCDMNHAVALCQGIRSAGALYDL